VVWHDGKPFSGKDVVATVRKILDPAVRAMHLRNNFVDLEDITIVEIASPAALVRAPRHDATRALVAVAQASEVQRR
jgi:ABC-type transport system substrate-binding protein